MSASPLQGRPECLPHRSSKPCPHGLILAALVVFPGFLLALPAFAAQTNSKDEEGPAPSHEESLSIAKRAAPPLPPCAVCDSTGRRKAEPLKAPYILFEGDPDPDPAGRLGWSPCAACARGKEQQAAYDAEKARLARRAAQYQAHEEKLGLKFTDFETACFTGHYQTTPAEARESATWLAKLGEALREQGAAWLPDSPAEIHLVVCENKARFQAYLEYFVEHVEPRDANWRALAAESASFGSRDVAVVRRDRVVSSAGSTLNHLVVFCAGHLLVNRASGGKVPDWFAEGFSSYCESLLFGFPCCYSIRYEPNRLDFDLAWAKSLAEALRQGKGREWKVIFTVSLIGMSKVEYQECWSIVRYLALTDKDAFAKLPTLFRDGLDTTAALEKAYGKPILQLEAQWKAWACQGK